MMKTNVSFEMMHLVRICQHQYLQKSCSQSVELREVKRIYYFSLHANVCLCKRTLDTASALKDKCMPLQAKVLIPPEKDRPPPLPSDRAPSQTLQKSCLLIAKVCISSHQLQRYFRNGLIVITFSYNVILESVPTKTVFELYASQSIQYMRKLI